MSISACLLSLNFARLVNIVYHLMSTIASVGAFKKLEQAQYKHKYKYSYKYIDGHSAMVNEGSLVSALGLN